MIDGEAFDLLSMMNYVELKLQIEDWDNYLANSDFLKIKENQYSAIVTEAFNKKYKFCWKGATI